MGGSFFSRLMTSKNRGFTVILTPLCRLWLSKATKLCGQAFEDANLDMMSTRPLLEEEDEDEDEDFSDED